MHTLSQVSVDCHQSSAVKLCNSHQATRAAAAGVALAASAAAGGGALGITAKSSAVFNEVFDQKTGEIQRFTLDHRRGEYVLERDPSEARFARFALQSVARSILRTSRTPRGTPWRLMDCLRTVTGSEVAVLYSPSVDRAHFAGLATCGSVWACPVCSAKVSERRKLEVVQAADLHKLAGGGLYLVTMTWAHHRHDDLDLMVKASRLALTRLRKQRAYVKNNLSIDYVGMIRAFEVTHGDSNGWHPHFHELVFVKKKLTTRQLDNWKKTLFNEWRKQCINSGLGEPNRKAGITIIEAESAAEYVSKFGNSPKWGIGSELVKHQSKHGRNGSRSPWDILRLYSDGDTRFGILFKQYVFAFFGARQLVWTPGLKQIFGIDELTDEQLAEREEENSFELLRISKETWKKVLNQPFESRCLILRLAETGGLSAVLLHLSYL